MKFGGWIFMIVSWTLILSLATFCFSRIFRKGLGGEEGVGAEGKDKERKERG